MNKIKVLPSELSNKIAAGEVVERPVSIVKEFIENSLDAGARNIIIEVKNAGISYIRVTDDGCGISPDDIDIAFLRHSTSKISSIDDLFSIKSLGFRGEALAAISSVSSIDMFTRRKEDKIGTFAKIENGKVVNKQDAGCPFGTSIIVKDLFSNVPARLKFLKSNKTECGYIFDIIERMALSDSSVSFRFINEGKQRFFTPGDGDDLSVIYSVYGGQYSKFSIPVDYEENNIHVYGFVGTRELSRPNRNFQTVFLNSRYIKSKLVSDAIEDACKTRIMASKYPFFVIYLNLSCDMVDINVHPTKIHAKFDDERSVYNAVYFAIKNAFEKNSDIKEEKNLSLNMSYAENNNNISCSGENASDIISYSHTVLKQGEDYSMPHINIGYTPLSDFKGEQTNNILPESSEKIDRNKEMATDLSESTVEQFCFTGGISSDENQVRFTSVDIDDFKIIGQVFDSYILAQKDDEFIIIDQHACHERKYYEQIIDKSLPQMNQILLIPVTVILSKTEAALVERYIDDLVFTGFDLEFISENAVIIRQIPLNITHDEVKDTFLVILDEISRGSHKLSFREKLIESLSCKSAIKANSKLSESEMRDLVSWALNVNNVDTCPHGRPITYTLTKREIEKIFKRV